jgi:hypothetical protein
MIAYMIGAVVTYVLFASAGALSGWSWLKNDPTNWLVVLSVLVLAPSAAAWFGAESVNRFAPRRDFDWRIRTRRSTLAGALSAAGCVLLSAVALALLRGGVPEVAVITGFAFLTSASAAWLLPRRLATRCVVCGYELTGVGGPRCPECGCIGSRGDQGQSTSAAASPRHAA